MLLTDFKNNVTINDLNSLLQEYFNYDIPLEKLNISIAINLLESSRKKINEVKNSELFHTSENSPSYLGLLTTEKLLEAWIDASQIHTEDIIKLRGKSYYFSGGDGGDWYRVNKTSDGKIVSKIVTSGDIISDLNNAKEDKDELKPESKPEVGDQSEQEPEQTQVNNVVPKQVDSVPTENNQDWKDHATNNITPAASHVANFLGATVGAFKAGLKGEGIHKDWGKMLPSVNPKNMKELKGIIDKDFLNQNTFSKLKAPQKSTLEKFFASMYTPGKIISHDDVINTIKKNKLFSNIPPDVKAQIAAISSVLNKFAQKTNESIIKDKAINMLYENFNSNISYNSFSKQQAKLILEDVFDIIEELHENKQYNNSLEKMIKTARSVIDYIRE